MLKTHNTNPVQQCRATYVRGLERLVDRMLKTHNTNPVQQTAPPAQIAYEVVGAICRLFEETLREQGIYCQEHKYVNAACLTVAASWKKKTPSAGVADLWYQSDRDVQMRTCADWQTRMERHIVSTRANLWNFAYSTHTDGSGSHVNMVCCEPVHARILFIIAEQKIRLPTGEPDDHVGYRYGASVSVAFRHSDALRELLQQQQATYFTWSKPWEMFSTLVQTIESQNCTTLPPTAGHDVTVRVHHNLVPSTGPMSLTELNAAAWQSVIDGFGHADAQRGVSPKWFSTLGTTITNKENTKFFWALDTTTLLFIVRARDVYMVGTVRRSQTLADRAW